MKMKLLLILSIVCAVNVVGNFYPPMVLRQRTKDKVKYFS